MEVPRSEHAPAVDPAHGRRVVDERYVSGAYLAANEDWHEGDAGWKARQVAHMLAAHRLAPDTICDIGCGTGGVLDELRLLVPGNPKLAGYEVSSKALSLIPNERRRRIEFIGGSHDLDNRRFDLMLCLDVLEHVDDYYGFLRSARSKATLAIFHIPIEIAITTVLRPGPILETSRRVGHIHHFNQVTALEALRYSGYSIIDSFHTIPALEQPAGGVRQRFGRAARIAAAKISLNLAARVMTGFPLLVLCAAEEETAP